jgi:hypothetical protein
MRATIAIYNPHKRIVTTRDVEKCPLVISRSACKRAMTWKWMAFPTLGYLTAARNVTAQRWIPASEQMMTCFMMTRTPILRYIVTVGGDNGNRQTYSGVKNVDVTSTLWV